MDTLIYQGGEVKSLGNNKIGGHILLFTTGFDPDADGDYFDTDTDFDLEDGDRVSGYYKHGFDVKIGNRKIGKGFVTKDEKGLWMEGQIEDREEYASEIMELVDAGKLGYSTGALSHLVRREAKNRAKSLNYVSHWPLKEWSLLPNPAEPRTLAVSLKMWAEGLKEPPPDDEPATTEEDGNTAASQVKAAVSIATVRELEDYLRDAGRCSRKEAQTVISNVFNSLRDAGEREPTPEVTPPVHSPTTSAAARFRELSLFREAHGLAAAGG